MENHTSYQTCYIAFLDMLGFKNMIKDTSCDEILEIFSKIKKPISIICATTEHPEIDITEKVNMKIMSDSICFYIDAVLPNALYYLLTCCWAFRRKLLFSSPPMLIRGAIILGEIYNSGDIMFGPGLTKAYLMEEQNAKYPRIIMTKETLDHGKRNTEDFLLPWYNQVVSKDDDAFYVIEYEMPINQDQADIERLITHIEYILDSTIDDSIRAKYLYLKKHLSHIYQQEGENHA